MDKLLSACARGVGRRYGAASVKAEKWQAIFSFSMRGLCLATKLSKTTVCHRSQACSRRQSLLALPYVRKLLSSQGHSR